MHYNLLMKKSIWLGSNNCLNIASTSLHPSLYNQELKLRVLGVQVTPFKENHTDDCHNEILSKEKLWRHKMAKYVYN